MFVKLDKADVDSISVVGVGRDTPCGDIYVNTEHISVIDGQFVSTEKFAIGCTDKGLRKVLSAIEMVGAE